MEKLGGNRNFGFGKQLAYAGHMAVRAAYRGHFATVAAHSNRWRAVVGWCRAHAIRDAREITREILAVYGEDLAEAVERGDLAVSYAQNLLSTANTVLWALRGDRAVRVSPAELVGQRTSVRTAPPAGLDMELVMAAAQALVDRGHHRAAIVVQLTRHFGLRIREASLLDLHGAWRHAEQRGSIRITEGTKGGRGHERERWAPASAEAAEFLGQTVDEQGDGRNIIPADMRWIDFNTHLHAVAIPVFHQHGLIGFHDFRASYACARYSEITGQPAPCIAGIRQAEKTADHAARLQIAGELGHGRADVLGAYVGSSR